MTNINLKANGSIVASTLSGKITSGMVGLDVHIEYDDQWSGLNKTAFFRSGDFVRKREAVGVYTTVPWEVLRKHGKTLDIGLEGRDADGNIVMPTVWATIGTIFQGAQGNVPAAPNPGSGNGENVGGAVIDDSQASLSTTWSSKKIGDMFDQTAEGAQSNLENAMHEVWHDLGLKVETVNGIAPDENGNVEIETGGSAEGAVLYTEQELTTEQQAQARENIGAIGDEDIAVYTKDNIDAFNNAFIQDDGSTAATNSWKVSPFIEIEPGQFVEYTSVLFPNRFAVAFYDETQSLLSTSQKATSNKELLTETICVPDGCKYIRYTTFVDATEYSIRVYMNPCAKAKYVAEQALSKVNELDRFEVVTYSTNNMDDCKKAYLDTNGEILSTSKWRLTPYIKVRQGSDIKGSFYSYTTVSPIVLYDRNLNIVETIPCSANGLMTVNQQLPDTVCFVRWSMIVRDDYQWISVVSPKAETEPVNVLVLGDSYSKMGYWVDAMKAYLPVKNLLNLGVSSATVRDKNADRVAHPYNSRPKTTTTKSDNTNTLACQLQWLKRLMDGADLDSGESKVYEHEHPDVIIIEGGMNDYFDGDNKVTTYQEQFLKPVQAYYQQGTQTPTEQTVYVPTPLEEIDRTCFAGAYRYICQELADLFPNAQIFITTASHMNYFNNNPNEVYGKIAEQQRAVANIMSYSVIDWHAEGNLNTMLIGLNGSGTADEPYTFNGGDEWTTDLLHPNAKGGARYGKLAAKVILSRI